MVQGENQLPQSVPSHAHVAHVSPHTYTQNKQFNVKIYALKPDEKKNNPKFTNDNECLNKMCHRYVMECNPVTKSIKALMHMTT